LLWQLAEAILPQRDCGHFNQALMELGSLVCTPREPKCDACPLQLLCPTRREGLQGVIPAPKRQPQMEDLHEVAVIIVRHGQVLLRKCAEGERWAGLWDFPRFGVTAGNGPSLTQQIADRIRQLTGVEFTSLQHVTTLRHGVTRFRIKLDGYIAEFERAGKKNGEQTQQWVKSGDLESFPLSTTGRKLAKFWHTHGATGKTATRRA
jgi:A/G-specific adenine glycosylase